MRIRDAKKEKLVKQQAVDLILKEGLNGFSMQKLAKACNISVATLYIYYTNKQDLIIRLGIEVGKQMQDATMKGFDANMSFAEGLKKQWENRAMYALKNKKSSAFFENIKHSVYCEPILKNLTESYRPLMQSFTKKAITNKEIRFISFESYWAVAYGPLYTLLKFEQDGKSVGNRPFKFSKKIMYESLEMVIKALKP